MRVGVHCSVRNGFVAALREASSLGCQTVQIFTQNPRGWRTRVYAEEEFSVFRREREKLGLHPVVVHSPYLPNLCTSRSDLHERSCLALRDDLTRCEKLGADYLVIHPGAYSSEAGLDSGIERIVLALNQALDGVKGKIKILIENVAGGGRRVGSRFSEIARILNGVRNSGRMGVCFDTCHALGAGYDLSRPEGVKATVAEFDHEVGLDRIHVFHVNDSKAPLNSHLDIHQHLGAGKIGLEGLRLLLNRPSFKDCAFILETPKNPAGSDTENLKLLRQCFSEAVPTR